MIVNGVGRSVVKEGKSERYAWRTLSILFERELSFVEWFYLFTFCATRCWLARLGAPTFPSGCFLGWSSLSVVRKGEDGLRKISGIPWKGYCGGCN